MDDPDLPDRGSPIMAIDALARLGIGDVSSLTHLERAALQGDSRVRTFSIQAIGSLACYLDIRQESSLVILNIALSDRDWLVVEAAADSLGTMAEGHVGDTSSIKLLNALFTHSDHDIRLRAVSTLTRLAEMNVGEKSSITGLNILLKDPHEDVREAAAEAECQLAHIKLGESSSIVLLNDLLRDPDEGVRLSAVAAVDELAMIGIGDASSLGPVKALLYDGNAGIRDLAGICLFSLAKYLDMGDEHVIGRLNRLLTDDGRSTTRVTALTLREMARLGMGSPSSLLPLDLLLDDKDDQTAEAAAEAIYALAQHMKIGDIDSVRMLNRRLKRDVDGCYCTAMALGSLAGIRLGDQGSIGPLNRMLRSTKQECVLMAALVIGNLAKIGIGDVSSITPLRDMLGKHENDQCGVFAENALRDLAMMGIE
jgi:HEAT repeat protein